MNPRRPADDPQPRPGASAAATSPGAQPAPQRALKPVAAPAPSLPKGGGAIRGLGEKFSVNAATGTAGLQVPIATSPGRSGFHPELALSYDSGAGNGPFGVGWQLSVPQIARKTDKGLPRYDDARESDTFVLSGAEDLVPVLSENGTIDPLGNGGESVQRYRPRVEGAFARIERRQVAGGAPYWRVITRDNISIGVDAVVYADVSSPTDAVLRVEQYMPATLQLAATTLRSIIGKMELDEVLAKRSEINLEVQSILDARVEQWGIDITAVEIKDISLPAEMKRAMARQAEAERERRAKVIMAEGELQAAAKLTEAARLISSEPAALQLRLYQTMVEVAAQPNMTIVLPVPIELLAGGAGSGTPAGTAGGTPRGAIGQLAATAAAAIAKGLSDGEKNSLPAANPGASLVGQIEASSKVPR